MKINAVIIDDFYQDPDSIRDFVLKQEFNVKGNYPGVRTKDFRDDNIKKIFEDLTGETITDWELGYNGCFQYTTKDMDSWVHRDGTDWAGIVYLTPDAPPSAGTAFFVHNETGRERITPDTPKADEDMMNRDSNNMSKWTQVDNVGNKYNRLSLFRGTRSHRSMDYFGDSKENGRLFQLFFFNVKKD